jgi:hypothetical protein
MLKNYLKIKNKRYFRVLTLSFIIVLAFALRAYKIGDNYYFSGELGKELMYIREYYLKGNLPLSGMGTSHEWLTYGPLYYWIMLPLYAFLSQSPYILFWNALAVSLLGLILNYYVFKKVADEKTALISTLIQAISPILIWQTRLSKLHVYFWILIPLLILSAYNIWHGRKKWLFWSGLIYGIMFSFHFSQIPLFGVFLILFLIKKNVYKYADLFKFLLGLILPNITYIWRSLKLALWVPYRVFNPENKDPEGTLISLYEFFGRSLFWDKKLWIVGLLIFASCFFVYIFKNYQKIKDDFLAFILISFIGVTVLANILHGAPPIHYFLPIFTLIPVIFSLYLKMIKYWPVILMVVTFINLTSFMNDPLFYKTFSGKITGSDIVSFETLNGAAEHIVNDAGEKDIKIKRIGPFDYFPENYSQNYKYLILLKGGKIDENSENIYVIKESETEINVQK